MVNQKKLSGSKAPMWESLVITLFIFLVGILIGVLVEDSYSQRTEDLYLRSETDLLDIQTQKELLDSPFIDCELAVDKNIEFGDRIYEDAKLLEKYESSAKITDKLREQHRRYDMLRVIFWQNSIKIKEKCENAPLNIVFLYNFEPESLKQKSNQGFFSDYLFELKKEYGNSFMLIPIARDMDLNSLDIMTQDFNLSVPAVIVDEELVITSADSLVEIKDYLGKED